MKRISLLFIFIILFVFSLSACNETPNVIEKGFSVTQNGTIYANDENLASKFLLKFDGIALDVIEENLTITLVKKESENVYLYLVSYKLDEKNYNVYVRANVTPDLNPTPEPTVEPTVEPSPEPTKTPDDKSKIEALKKAFKNENFTNVLIYDDYHEEVSLYANNYAAYYGKSNFYFKKLNNSWRIYNDNKWVSQISINGNLVKADNYYKEILWGFEENNIDFSNAKYNSDGSYSLAPTGFNNIKNTDTIYVRLLNDKVDKISYYIDSKIYNIGFYNYGENVINQDIVDGLNVAFATDSLKLDLATKTANSLELKINSSYVGAPSFNLQVIDDKGTLVYEDEVAVKSHLSTFKDKIIVSSLKEETNYKFVLCRKFGSIITDPFCIYSFTTDYNDNISPTLKVEGAVIAEFGADYLSIIKQNANISDNHDKLNELKLEFDFSVINGIGDFEIPYTITDQKGNSTSGKLLMHIVADSNGPEITTDGIYFVYNSIDDVPDLKSFFAVSDAKDGEILVLDSMLSIQNSDLVNGVNKVMLTVSDSDGNIAKLEITIEIREGEVLNRVTIKENITKLDDCNLPSVGSPKVLVIPIAIGDYPATEQMRERIQKGFFGSSEDTGWESLTSYYKKSSYGKLNITGTVTDWYHAKKAQNYYAKYNDDNNYIYGSTMLIDEALKYFKNDYNYNDYDTNGDGCIDSVYVIYNVPIGGNGSTEEEDFYWAFTYWDFYERDYGYNASTYAYVFASYDFFDEELNFSKKKLAINSETIIHETGHLFGMNDFYDSDSTKGTSGGFGGADMMDYNIGDHHPYTKMMLGWHNPYLVNKSGTYKIADSTTTGDAIIVSRKTTFDSPFAEYFIIDLYSFKGLNSLEVPSFYETNKEFAGVRVTKINASLTSETEDGVTYYTLKYNNGDTQYKEIELMEADYNGRLHCSQSDSSSSLSDYYLPSSTAFGTGSWTSYRLSDGSQIPFTMKVISCDKDYATIEITMK